MTESCSRLMIAMQCGFHFSSSPARPVVTCLLFPSTSERNELDVCSRGCLSPNGFAMDETWLLIVQSEAAMGEGSRI